MLQPDTGSELTSRDQRVQWQMLTGAHARKYCIEFFARTAKIRSPSLVFFVAAFAAELLELGKDGADVHLA